MKILITNIYGSFVAEKLENIYFGADVAGFRARVVDSNLTGWRNGEIIECGTLTKYRAIN